jgi:oligopeptide/dipeptide ABC transporter ATP-binding protein
VLRAVDDVSFTLAANRTLGLVGESGCGKSTTGRLLINLLTPTSGTVLFSGQDVHAARGAARKNLRRKMQIIFQDPYSSLDPRMKVWDALAEPLAIHRLAAGRDVDARVTRLLDLVGLSAAQANRYPHEFSGGQRQRIGIARALAVEPQFIVCDEPVSALDVSVQSQMLNLLKDLQSELDLTYVFVAHGLGVVKYMSDDVAVMYLGRIVEQAPAADLFAAPLHPYSRALLDAIPVPDPTRRRERHVLQGNVPSPIDPPPGCHFAPRCPLADEGCRASIPPLRALTPGHLVACHKAEITHKADASLAAHPDPVSDRPSQPTEKTVPT